MRKDIVVIGTSAGGVEALRTVLGGLPREFPGSIFVVMHTAAESPGILADILERAGPLPATCVRDRDQIRRGHVYVAQPDRHLVVQQGVVRATRGPRENRFRPAIDPLFRSAAVAFGRRVVGVILTGGLDDGVAGLWAVNKVAGTTIVQDPRDALFPTLPQNALNRVAADHVVKLTDVAPLLVRLAADDMPDEEESTISERMRIEVDIASEREALDAGVLGLGKPSMYACPECHGVLMQISGEDKPRYRCHTGHGYSTDSLLDAMHERADEAMWNAVRALEENAMLLDRTATHGGDSGSSDVTTRSLRERGEQAQRHARIVRGAAIEDPDGQRAEASPPPPSPAPPEN